MGWKTWLGTRHGLTGALLLSGFTAACGSEDERPPGPDEQVASSGGDPVAAADACTTANGCAGCGSCATLCACAGGGAACTEQCAAPDEPSIPPPPPSEPAEEPVVEPGQDGRTTLTLVTDEFEVPPGAEQFRCQNFANPFGRDVAIIESQSAMAPGSHHMFVFQGSGFTQGGLQSCGGLEFGPHVHGSQRPEESITYPDGVGRFLPAGDNLRIQVHYLNTTDEPIGAFVATTLIAAEIDAVPVLASHLFINTLSISVEPQSTGTATKSCGIPHDANLLSATSHMHQFGVYFEARSSDGQLVYETNEWAEPEPWRFEPPLFLSGGSQIDIRCEYENTLDQPLSFGESAATNEMCILTGVYFPAPAGESITCLF